MSLLKLIGMHWETKRGNNLFKEALFKKYFVILHLLQNLRY